MSNLQSSRIDELIYGPAEEPRGKRNRSYSVYSIALATERVMVCSRASAAAADVLTRPD